MRGKNDLRTLSGNFLKYQNEIFNGNLKWNPTKDSTDKNNWN